MNCHKETFIETVIEILLPQGSMSALASDDWTEGKLKGLSCNCPDNCDDVTYTQACNPLVFTLSKTESSSPWKLSKTEKSV